MVLKRLHVLAVAGLLLMQAPGAVAQEQAAAEEAAAAEILPPEALPQADVATLAAETELLDGISRGVALSLAYCELAGTGGACEPAVSREELLQLVQAVERRITLLAERYNSGEGDPALEEVLLSYVDVRDEYNRHMERLEDVVAGPDAGMEALVDVPVEGGGELPPEIFDIFRDADEPLTDAPVGGVGE